MRPLRNVGLVLAATSVICLTSCKQQAPTAAKPDLSTLTDDFVYGSLALSPSSATSAGYHQHKGVNLDEQIDDFSAAGIDQQHKFYSDFHNRLASIQQDSLSAEDRADYQIIDNQVNLSLLDFEKIQSYRHNPTVYVELVGNALFNPFVLEYAPLDKRYRAIIQRLAKDSGADSAGRSEPDGCARDLESRGAGGERRQPRSDRQDLRAKAPDALKADYDRAAAAGIGRSARIHEVPEGRSVEKDQRLAARKRELRSRSSPTPWFPERRPSKCWPKPKPR